jgi:hypothetical protein
LAAAEAEGEADGYAVRYPEEIVVGLFSIVAVLVVLGYGCREIWWTFQNDPTLVRGRVLEKPIFESDQPSLVRVFFSLLFGQELKLAPPNRRNRPRWPSRMDTRP